MSDGVFEEDSIPANSHDWYQAYVSMGRALGADAALDRVGTEMVDVAGLTHAERARFDALVKAGNGRGESPKVDRAPDEWDGVLTDVGFGDWGSRTTVTVSDGDNSNTSMLQPLSEYADGGYYLVTIDAIIEFYDIDPLALEQNDIELPVPLRGDPFDEDDPLPVADFTAVKRKLLEQASWSDNEDAFLAHEPWRPDEPVASAPAREIGEHRGSGVCLSVNPKYRGAFDPTSE